MSTKFIACITGGFIGFLLYGKVNMITILIITFINGVIIELISYKIQKLKHERNMLKFYKACQKIKEKE